MAAGRLAIALALVLALAGCGGGGDRAASDEAAIPSLTATPATPPPPRTPAVTTRAYVRALDGYCAHTTAALRRLSRSHATKRDPAAPVAALAGSIRAGVERLGRLTPPAREREEHLLVLAQGREAADRLDTGVQLARGGEPEAATSALLDLQDLLPRLPGPLRRAAPACA